MTLFTWDDNTPWVSFAYDAASRVTDINNPNAYIQRDYYNDNLLYRDTEQIAGVVGRQVGYTYDADGNRDTLSLPGYTFGYTYTGRNQLKTINGWAAYDYDANGNLTTRTLNNGTHTDYAYDGLDRITWVTHSFGRWFNYDYYAGSNNCKWTKRWNGQAALGEVFGYDLADQVTAVKLNIANPDNTSAGGQTIFYDANGNRTTFRPYGPTDTYYINNNSLNQYNRRNNVNASYDYNGNLTNGFDGSTYAYDAQNRLTNVTLNGATMQFKYDGLNRQVSRSVGGPTVYNIWDGWDLVEEFQGTGGGQVVGVYMYGAGGLVAAANNANLNYYYQDGSGSTSHITDENGNLKEWYRYDLQGTPLIYDANNNQLSGSARNVRHLFTGRQWYGELGLYDLRNRFYSPDIGRFLQPDPIGFRGDRSNLYRHCGNNPVTRWDFFGLQVSTSEEKGDGDNTPVIPVEVRAPEIPDPSSISRTGFLPGSFGGFFPRIASDNPSFHHDYNPVPRPEENHQPSVEHPPPSNVPPQNPQQLVSTSAPASPSSPSAPAAGVFSHWDAVTPIIAQANMRLDDDGSGPRHNDINHQGFTSYFWWYRVNLNADIDAYVVAPQYRLKPGSTSGRSCIRNWE